MSLPLFMAWVEGTVVYVATSQAAEVADYPYIIVWGDGSADGSLAGDTYDNGSNSYVAGIYTLQIKDPADNQVVAQTTLSLAANTNPYAQNIPAVAPPVSPGAEPFRRDLGDFNFELLPSESWPEGARFGIGQPVSLDAEGFAPGSTDWAIQDTESPISGHTQFGVDRLLGPTWNWQLHVNRADTSGALATLGEFRTAWHALHIRETPGLVLPLRYMLEGRVRRIYGRPRRFEAPPTNQILSGYVPVSVDFKCIDGFHYDDEATTVALSVGSEADDETLDSGGGFQFPVTFPADTLAPTRRQARVLVRGDAPTHPVVRFNGPVVNPRIVTPDWTLGINYNIPAGQYVEIDTRPWAMTALLNGNTSVAGSLLRRQRLSKIVFKPGPFEARFVGASSGMSTASVTWRNAWNSI